MKQNRFGMIQITCAIFFALMILLNSWLLGESEYAQTAMFFLIALWVSAASVIDKKANKAHGKKQCRLS